MMDRQTDRRLVTLSQWLARSTSELAPLDTGTDGTTQRPAGLGPNPPSTSRCVTLDKLLVLSGLQFSAL